MTQTKEFPSKLYGRVSKSGQKMVWTRTGYGDGDRPEDGVAGIYESDKGHRTRICAGAFRCLMTDGRMEALDGKEVLTWGDEFGAQLERLGITGHLLYQGGGKWGEVPSVYWFSDEAFEKLGADPEENWEGKDAAWRHAYGGNIDTETRATVNGHYIYGPGPGKFDELLNYICDTAGASQPRNVAVVTAELAKANFVSLGTLFARYQPVQPHVAPESGRPLTL